MLNKVSFLTQAFARNIGLLSLGEQERLQNSRIAIAGMGGVGGLHLITLIRSGIGSFNIADFDTFEIENINRQYGARSSTIGSLKCGQMKIQALEINPHANINIFDEGATLANIDRFLQDVDLVMDGLDAFAFKARRMLFNKALEKGIPCVTAGPIGFGASLMIFTKNSMSFDKYFDVNDNMDEANCLASFFAGLTPSSKYINYIDRRYVSLKEQRGPSLDIACKICAGLAAAEAVKLILGRGRVLAAPYNLRIDPYLNTHKWKYLPMGNRSPWQIVKRKIISKKLRSYSSAGLLPSLPKVNNEPANIINSALDQDTIRFLVNAACLAISGDNSQHWRFKWDGLSLRLFEDKQRSEFFYSINGEPLFVAYGALLENLKIAASAVGLSTEVKITNNPANSEIAEIQFRNTQSDCDPLYPYMYERCTNRAQYQRTTISKSHIETLSAEAANYPGVTLTWGCEEKQRNKLAQLIAKAEKVIWENENYHRDLYKWLRFNDDARDGLTKSMLNLKSYELYSLRQLKNWKLVKILNHFGLSTMATATSKRWVKNCGGFFLINQQGQEAQQYIQSGSCIERIWIKAASLGLSVQPMTILIALISRLKFANGDGLSIKHQILAKQLSEEVDKLFPNCRDLSKVMLFRLGYASPPSHQSRRRNLEEVLDF